MKRRTTKCIIYHNVHKLTNVTYLNGIKRIAGVIVFDAIEQILTQL